MQWGRCLGSGKSCAGSVGEMMLMRKITVLAMSSLLLAGLGGCREEDRNRPLASEKGVYTGPTGTKLNDEQLRALRQRSSLQSGDSL